MERLQRAALISFLAEELLKNGSWCGETHIQKSVYLLQEVCAVPTSFEFILYKHGPFSFELRDELTSMRADGLLTIVVQYPYGPKLVPTDSASTVRKRFPKTMEKHAKAVALIGRHVGSRTVADLEKLATALYVERERGLEDADEWAHAINALKPHVSVEAALAAIEDLQRIEVEATRTT